MSIDRLLIQNSNSGGFWIQHRTWQNMCAHVTRVAGRDGPPGQTPVFHHSNMVIRFFDVRSGRPVAGNGTIDSPEDRGYILIAEPPWSRRRAGQHAQATADSSKGLLLKGRP